jgi:nucleotide-binding universal stress UspA family protein
MGGPLDVYEKIIASPVSAAHELLAERLEDCRGLSADGMVVVGSPTGELVLASEGLDLLVLGSRRWGPVRRLGLGSTSERVIRHAACPVLVPPRDGASEHGDAASVSDATMLG